MIPINAVLRVARPTDHLKKIGIMYAEGLGFEVLGEFEAHDGFDGIILGHKKYAYHLEFTHHKDASAGKVPTQDNLLIFYISDTIKWKSACSNIEQAGFKPVASFNPYWDITGRTFEDLDGYRIVLQNREWSL